MQNEVSLDDVNYIDFNGFVERMLDGDIVPCDVTVGVIEYYQGAGDNPTIYGVSYSQGIAMEMPFFSKEDIQLLRATVNTIAAPNEVVIH
jgi:hypothetical protein